MHKHNIIAQQQQQTIYASSAPFMDILDECSTNFPLAEWGENALPATGHSLVSEVSLF